MRIMFLDDDPQRHQFVHDVLDEAPQHEITYVHTCLQATYALKSESVFDIVFLDHDLADNRNGAGYSDAFSQDTGLDVARFITHTLAANKRPHKIIIHSLNPVGALRMYDELKAYSLEVFRVPYGDDSFINVLDSIQRKH